MIILARKKTKEELFGLLRHINYLCNSFPPNPEKGRESSARPIRATVKRITKLLGDEI